VHSVPTLTLDLVLTLAAAAVVLWIGAALQRRIGWLARSNIPSPAVGGLLFALATFALHARGLLDVAVDPVLRNPLQIAFFSTLGLRATLSLLRGAGRRALALTVIIAGTAIVQNVVGIGMARMLGAPAALGIICGSLTLTGGPATGLAFAETFEGIGVAGARALIVAAATFGIGVASIVGNPVATSLIRRFRLATARELVSKRELPPIETSRPIPPHDGASHVTGPLLMRHLIVLLIVMGVGAIANGVLLRLGIILPSFMASVIVAAVTRNLDDRFGWLRLDEQVIEIFGAVTLALFFAVALMELKIWQMADLALPMFVILAVQVVVTVAYAVLVTFTTLGRDYEAAVATTGHIGFAIGIASNAVANMETLVRRYGPAPMSVRGLPAVALFAIDLTNPFIILYFLHAIR
jgi:ESS family glutamate:Na+ symporter